jgi:hypothetical protein
VSRARARTTLPHLARARDVAGLTALATLPGQLSLLRAAAFADAAAQSVTDALSLRAKSQEAGHRRPAALTILDHYRRKYVIRPTLRSEGGSWCFGDELDDPRLLPPTVDMGLACARLAAEERVIAACLAARALYPTDPDAQYVFLARVICRQRAQAFGRWAELVEQGVLPSLPPPLRSQAIGIVVGPADQQSESIEVRILPRDRVTLPEWERFRLDRTVKHQDSRVAFDPRLDA